MHIGYLRDVFRKNADRDAIVWQDTAYKYQWLLDTTVSWEQYLSEKKVGTGTVVSLEADFTPNAIALLLALISRSCIIVPLTESVAAKRDEFQAIAEVEICLKISRDESCEFSSTKSQVSHPVLLGLKNAERPGLVLFSSGSTGQSKAAVHDLVPLLEKFQVERQTLKTITFLLFDHIGGINTLLYNLANGGCIVTVQDRSPDYVCRIIQDHRVELLPTSPTFLNLMLVSEAYRRFDLSSLKLITYGTEVMSENTLKAFSALFPTTRLLQTYGLSEVGILRSKSRDNDSLWVKIGGEGFETRVVDGLLEIKAKSAMLGYLNAASPFTEDGWFRTGDAVEVDGEYFRILGRKSEIINVGGEKVYPVEVENVLQMMEGVENVSVKGETHPITGQIVIATVKLGTSESVSDFRKRMHMHCRDKLPRFKIPQKVTLSLQDMHGERFKKMRNS